MSHFTKIKSTKNSKSHIEIRMQYQSPFHNAEHWLENYEAFQFSKCIPMGGNNENSKTG